MEKSLEEKIEEILYAVLGYERSAGEFGMSVGEAMKELMKLIKTSYQLRR